MPPSWDKLFEAAVAQEGYFTTKEAAEAGYSPQLLQKYLKNGRITRVLRGIYRIVHYPAGEHEDLVSLWLWSDKAGVFSHETALMLHDLSDVLPSKIHMTLPADWAKRRLRVPKGVVIHHRDVEEKDCTELGPVPLTTVPRTLFDCADTHVSLEFIDAALRQARTRRLIERDTERAVRARARAT
jgi:predicted transcriptional regulator of viral defense system